VVGKGNAGPTGGCVVMILGRAGNPDKQLPKTGPTVWGPTRELSANLPIETFAGCGQTAQFQHLAQINQP
jgi:hypothetical protein